jgi:hypothetical protein
MGMKKKNIEEIFQEKLRDYSQLPEEHVWDNLAASLDKKPKKRRIIPIWWKLGGVAAVLLLSFFLFRSPLDLPNGEESITKLPNTSGIEVPSDINNEPTSNTEIEKFESSKAENDLTGASEEKATQVGTPSEVYANESLDTQSAEAEATIVTKALVATATEANQKEQNLDKHKESEYAVISGSTEVIAQNKESSAVKTRGNSTENTTILPADPLTNSLAGSENTMQNKKEPTPEKEVSNEDKTSIFDAIAAQEIETEKEVPTNKWAVGPRLAPVFFSSLSQGSPIHSSFRNNAKSGNINLSYGLALSYNLSKRLKIRSGVHKVDFGYDTRDVSFSSSLNAATNGIIDNIDYSLSSRNLVVRSNTRSGKIASENAMDVSGPDPSLNGKMIQEFGYLEVPLELTYQILDRKLGVNVSGGVSSLFLVNNSVMLESEGIATEMGEANNLNDLNMSTNFGVGITYQLNSTLQLSLEPMFKYQLNTFSEAAGNFQPFSMGVYSGLNFKF